MKQIFMFLLQFLTATKQLPASHQVMPGLKCQHQNSREKVMLLKKFFTTSALTSALLASLTITNAQAEEWQFQAGLGIASTSEAWKEVDSTTNIVPIFSAQYGNWYFGDNALVGYHLMDQDDFGLSFGLGYRDDTYDSDGIYSSKASKAEVFEGYKSPDGDVTFITNGYWQMFSLTLEQDISGNSKGLTADFELEVPIFTYGDKFSLQANAGVHWQSSDYANYVYGISGEQIDTSKGRTAYTPGSVTNYSVGLNAMYQINKDWTMLAGVDYIKLDDKIESSPLVGDDKITSAFVGAVYSF